MKSTKTDPTLGSEVYEHLRELGIETPCTKSSEWVDSEVSEVVTGHFRDIMIAMGLDMSDDSLEGTPARIAKMFSSELFWGLQEKNFPKITTIENKMQYDTMLLERNIKVTSMCEHHFLPIIGVAHVAYIPKDKVIGLSKINRIVNYFSRRPQVQERLCEQIFHTLKFILGTDNVAVTIKASHSCVSLRGVQDTNSDTITTRLGGSFLKGTLRTEFFNSIKLD